MVNRFLEKRLNKCVAVLGLSMNVSNQRTGVNRDLLLVILEQRQQTILLSNYKLQ